MDKTLITGVVGRDLSLEEGKAAARQVGLAMLATLREQFGGLDRVKRVVKLLGMVNSAADFCHCGIGSDLDGAFGIEQTPGDLDTIADLTKLGPILAARGFSEADIAGIMSGNFLSFLRNAWK